MISIPSRCLSELAFFQVSYSRSEGGGVVAVLASRPNEFLHKEVSYIAGSENLRSTQVVVRSGSPLRATDLDVISARTAKCVIVLADNEVSAEEYSTQEMRAESSSYYLNSRVKLSHLPRF